MPRQRFERNAPTHEWQQLGPLLKDPAQLTYEIIRPVILGWETPKEQSAETGMPQRTIYYKANLFDQAGMASLLPPEPPSTVPKLEKRSLPPPMRQGYNVYHSSCSSQEKVLCQGMRKKGRIRSCLQPITSLLLTAWQPH